MHSCSTRRCTSSSERWRAKADVGRRCWGNYRLFTHELLPTGIPRCQVRRCCDPQPFHSALFDPDILIPHRRIGWVVSRSHRAGLSQHWHQVFPTMGVEPPFLYDPPSRLATSSSDFNPKRISQASLRPPSPREKQTTPLMNFNQHPDSFPVLPYGNTNARPMGAKTKDKVRWARAVLLGFRVVQLISATALFVAAICIRSIDTTDGWFVRIPVCYCGPMSPIQLADALWPGWCRHYTLHLCHLSSVSPAK